MKKFKSLLFLVLAVIAACAFYICESPLKTTKLTSAEFSDVPFTSSVFNHISLSQSGQVLDSSKLQTVTNGEKNTTYVITNKAVTINFKTPLNSYIKISNTTISDNFYRNEIKVKLDKADGVIPDTFMFKGNTYYYDIRTVSETDYIFIYSDENKTRTITNSKDSMLIRYNLEENFIEIFITTSFATNEIGFVDELGNPTETSFFNFTVSNTEYSINFQKPVVNFFNSTEPVVMFNTFKTDPDGNPYPLEKSIPVEQVYQKLQISFINNGYTEHNPLYFNINFNGFVYNYKLYTKVYNGENLLFVNYIDEYTSISEKISYNNSKNLATTFMTDEDGNVIMDGENPMIQNSIPAYNLVTGETNEFSLIFETTGRYSIEFYDSTHILGINNANYYSTSFFIREEGENISPFQNVYIVGQTISDSGILDDYIVSDSTLNKSVKIIIKNLADLGKDASGNEVKLSDVLENIIVKTTDFGIDYVKTEETIYKPEDIVSKLIDNDLHLEFSKDAYYQIIINPKQTDPENKIKPILYYFTIVKHAKTTFRFKNELREASGPYKTEIHNYVNPIADEILLKIKFSDSADEDSIKLNKTYVNRFQIKFGIKSVKIEQFTPTPANEDEKIPAGLYLKVYGVGDITVYLTFDGKTETLTLNSETGNNIISRTEYGKYKIKIVDSMGTESQEMTYEFKKEMNMSAIILVVLSSIIAAVIIIFVMRARGKVATR